MGPGPIQLGGMALNGQAGHSYRGWLELNLNGRGGIDVVNEVSLDQYVAGVIGSEVSVRWPTETLKAQAVAARTYAITTRAGGGLFDQYPDTRSQVYGGVLVRAPAHRRRDPGHARRGRDPRGQAGRDLLLLHLRRAHRARRVLVPGLASRSRGCAACATPTTPPRRAIAGRSRWPRRDAGARLRGLVKGRFLGIRVIRRGRSPRVVVAEIVGTRGITAVSGGQLRARLDLPDTWAYFAVVG